MPAWKTGYHFQTPENKSTKKDRSMTPLTSMKGRHKAGQLQSSEGLRIPNLAQICQRRYHKSNPGIRPVLPILSDHVLSNDLLVHPTAPALNCPSIGAHP